MIEHEVDTENIGGDGSGDTKKLDAFIDSDNLGGLFLSHALPSAIDKFVERGDTFEDLIIRADFRNTTYKNACMRLYRKMVHFHCPEGKTLIINLIAGDVAEKGKRIDILKQAVIGQLENERRQSVGNRIQGWLGGNKNNGKE